LSDNAAFARAVRSGDDHQGRHSVSSGSFGDFPQHFVIAL
jgi:hypothetical protein